MWVCAKCSETNSELDDACHVCGVVRNPVARTASLTDFFETLVQRMEGAQGPVVPVGRWIALFLCVFLMYLLFSLGDALGGGAEAEAFFALAFWAAVATIPAVLLAFSKLNRRAGVISSIIAIIFAAAISYALYGCAHFVAGSFLELMLFLSVVWVIDVSLALVLSLALVAKFSKSAAAQKSSSALDAVVRPSAKVWYGMVIPLLLLGIALIAIVRQDIEIGLRRAPVHFRGLSAVLFGIAFIGASVGLHSVCYAERYGHPSSARAFFAGVGVALTTIVALVFYSLFFG